MKGIIPLTRVMRSLERERIRQDLIKEWYQQRNNIFSALPAKVAQNN